MEGSDEIEFFLTLLGILGKIEAVRERMLLKLDSGYSYHSDSVISRIER